MNEKILKQAKNLAIADIENLDKALHDFFSSFDYDLAKMPSLIDALPPELAISVTAKMQAYYSWKKMRMTRFFYQYFILSTIGIMVFTAGLNLYLPTSAAIAITIILALLNIPALRGAFNAIPKTDSFDL
ncbi:MAG: hypothetical protein FWF59_14285 [Turicibacter sp.]|nr:hypothetical protein [Turicibacter sp.]